MGDCIPKMASGLSENENSAIEELRVQNQKNTGVYFGRPVEEEMEKLMRNNKKILKLGFSCNDAHWRDQIDRFMIRNNDIARRLRKRGSRANLGDEVVAVEKQLAKLTLVNPPADKKAWE